MEKIKASKKIIPSRCSNSLRLYLVNRKIGLSLQNSQVHEFSQRNTNRSKQCKECSPTPDRKNAKNRIKKNINSCLKNYETQKQNERIINRLLCPRRDQIILSSLQSTEYFRTSRLSAMSPRKQDGGQLFKQAHETQKLKIKNQNEYSLKIENQRMGKRLINTKSTFHPSQKNSFKDKTMNQGVKVFFTLNKNCEGFNKKVFYKSFHRENYGFGSTTLSIMKLEIDSFPKIDGEELMSLELLVHRCNCRLYHTEGIPYESLQKGRIKFGLRVKSIQESVPLRIWKFNGLEKIEIGMIDLSFKNYLNQLKDAYVEDTLAKNVDTKVEDQLTRKTHKAKVLVEEQISARLKKSKTQSHDRITILYTVQGKKKIL